MRIINVTGTIIVKCRIFALIIACFLTKSDVNATMGFASNGAWNQANTWLIGGINRVPACGDTLLIPSGMYGLAITPDGETVVSASGDNTVRLWSAIPYAERLRRADAAAR